MPQALIGFITPSGSGFWASIGLGTAFVVGATGIIASALVYGALAAAALLASTAFQPQKPEAPKPEDGKFNLKQSVPPLVYVLGQVKKAGDYVFLEETGGHAYHITVLAAHSIQGFVSHWLHDEQVSLDGNGYVVSPAHFGSRVRIDTRQGDNAAVPYAMITSKFPAVWGADHRGDGLATVAMEVQTVAAEELQGTFPSGMPQHQSIIQGHARIYDPRTASYGYTTNLALFRLWHLTHPVGGKLTLDDMYLPD